MRTKQKTFPGLSRLHSALQWVKKLNHQKPQGLCEKRRWHRAKGCPGLEGAGRAGVGAGTARGKPHSSGSHPRPLLRVGEGTGAPLKQPSTLLSLTSSAGRGNQLTTA